MTKKVIKDKFQQKQAKLENLEVVKRALAKTIIDHGPVELTAEDWERVAPMKLAIKPHDDKYVITVVI